MLEPREHDLAQLRDDGQRGMKALTPSSPFRVLHDPLDEEPQREAERERRDGTFPPGDHEGDERKERRQPYVLEREHGLGATAM